MTQPNKLLIYKSSAGSGKTYQLALEYIALCLINPNSYRHILAVTFTNKATAEMKGRIIQFLQILAKEDNELTNQVQEKTRLKKEEIKNRSAKVLVQSVSR